MLELKNEMKGAREKSIDIVIEIETTKAAVNSNLAIIRGNAEIYGGTLVGGIFYIFTP